MYILKTGKRARKISIFGLNMRDITQDKLNNAGYSLVELLTVIAIIGILMGGITYGINLAFCKDASKCASVLNDAIYETRMDSMTRTGTYKMTLKTDDGTDTGKYVVSIDNGTDVKDVYLDGNKSRKTNITVYPVDDAGTKGTAFTLPLVIQFDKSKGKVLVGEGSVTSEGIILFEVEGLRGNPDRNKSKVQLITATGKHTIGDF